MDDYSPQVKSFLNSAMGKEMMRSLKEDLHDTLILNAQEADDPNTAYGLLKEASGVIKVMNHIRFLASVPTDESSKD